MPSITRLAFPWPDPAEFLIEQHSRQCRRSLQPKWPGTHRATVRQHVSRAQPISVLVHAFAPLASATANCYEPSCSAVPQRLDELQARSLHNRTRRKLCKRLYTECLPAESWNPVRSEFVTAICGKHIGTDSLWRLCGVLNRDSAEVPNESEALLKRARYVGKYIVCVASNEANCADHEYQNNG